MTSQVTTMKFSDNVVSHGTSWYTKLFSSKEITIPQKVFSSRVIWQTRCWLFKLLYNLPKIIISLIQHFDRIKTNYLFFRCSYEYNTPTKGIGNLILFSRLMLQNKIIPLQERHPFSMPIIRFLLCVHIFQGQMIYKQHKFLWDQVMPPMP